MSKVSKRPNPDNKKLKNPQEGVYVFMLMCRFGRLGVLDGCFLKERQKWKKKS